MSLLRYITHRNVTIDPSIPVPEWGLSNEGRRRAHAMLDQPRTTSIARIVSSTETKAVETAEILATHLGLVVEVRPGIGENDRSATGFVPPKEFEALADAFFANPHASVQGWERAIDAQQRIAHGLEDLLASNEGDGDIAVIGHGGVGTLWYCHLTGVPIDRDHDQPGQGHYYTIDLTTRSVAHTWRPIDAIPS
ncbi:MAG: histidine phosphatase family protein [Acidimicrobiales bacterium]|nr:histidine phosphatase family protein [Acidimicrobiales bacterium]